MDNHLIEQADQYFRQRLSTDLDTLLAPIDGERPTGENLRGQGVYRRIREARRGDDASLPHGDRTPRRAEWEVVTTTALEALTGRSKDLRLAAWLTEARLHTDGVAALPAGLVLLSALSERYWDALHPEMVDDDPAYRTNIFDWLDAEAANRLKLEPLTGAHDAAPGYALADWERAVRAERSDEEQPRGEEPEAGTTVIARAFAQTTAETLRARLDRIGDTMRALDALGETLALTCASDAPAFSRLRDILGETHTLVGSELDRRGDQAAPTERAAIAESGTTESIDVTSSLERTPHSINSRADAYAWLTAAARYLASAEPHSPIPYVVDRTVEWGHMNAAELYRELFVENGGQLNVFDLMGIGQLTSATTDTP